MYAQRSHVVRKRGLAIAEFIEQIAQIEMRQRIFRIHFESLAILSLGFAPVARVEVDRAEIHERAGRRGVDLGSLQIRGDDFLHWRAGLLQLQTLLEPVLRFEARVAASSRGWLRHGL